ncbi:hypothetical protein [Paraburkholderia sacchari]|uniref:hypothetical protein n=1 Tax=Paraburkholderia sacchari TaxID=159450 RepID=UPI0005438FA9|nr:hypothetical protein [Paraburkholderia sacchari]NLP60856.1 hypothetical protein [Paraburkholderia sacchari]
MPFAFFHGIAQEGRTADELRKLWVDSLEAGLETAKTPASLHKRSVEVPYYGDLLADYTPDASATPQSVDKDKQYRSATAFRPPSPIDQIEAEFVMEIGRAKGRRFDKDDFKRSAKSGILRTLASIVPNRAQAELVDRVLTQVAAYLTSPSIRAEISEMADSALLKAESARVPNDSRLVVVGHSLGSVVALEALWRWRGAPVDLFITIGSPLSVPCIYSRLTMQPPKWPTQIRQWINVADKDDVVALHGAIDRSNLFSPCTKADKSQRADVLNILDIKNHMANHHGIAGYLDDPVVARFITDLAD